MKTLTYNEWLELSLEDRAIFTGIIKWDDGTIQYRKNNKYHRDEGQGPQFEKPDGHKEWCIDGLYHRLDGPAIIYPNGHKLYYIYGKPYTKEQFDFLKDLMQYRSM